MDNGPRTAIACTSCAKAKAKCDKKVPCTRCASKQTPCQSRSARRSFNVASRRANAQLSTSGTTSNGPRTNRVTKANAVVEAPIIRREIEKDLQLQWTLYPTTPSPSTHTFPSSKRPALSGSYPPDVDQFLSTNGQPYAQEAEQQPMLGDLSKSPLQFDISLTPMLHPMSGMDSFLGAGEGYYNQEDDDQFLFLGGLHNPLDFDLSILPDRLSPDSARFDMADSSSIETRVGASNGAVESSRISAYTSSDYISRNGSTTSISFPKSPPPSHKSRSASIYRRAIQEHEAVIAGQEGWPCFRCNPPIQSCICPKTAKVYLEGLEQTLKNQDTWNSWGARPDDVDRAASREILTEPFVGCTRDKLLAITQSFLHKALEIHRAGPLGSPESLSNSDLGCAEFIILPPPAVMEYFLRAYVCRFEPYYAFVPGGILKPNELMQLSNGKASSLLLLLMVAQGAMATSTVEARYLSSGLTEACRISLFDIIEKDVSLCSDPIVLRCALLFTTLAAWSGDKWHMDIAMGQRGMYIAMLSHAGMLESKVPVLECPMNTEVAWTRWKDFESKSRLVYSWVTIDQELSLFHDTAPMLSVTNLEVAMPDSELLWQAKSAQDWLRSHEEAERTSPKHPLSLRELFRRFIDGELVKQHLTLSTTQLRLLLHPLQALVCHLRQFLSCFSDGASYCKGSQAVTKSATRARLEEIQCLLQQWYSLSSHCIQNSANPCPASRANLIIYHLISLNTMVCFPEIERLARGEVVLGSFRQTSWLRIRGSEDIEEIFFHCGQVLRLVRSMPERVRPPWWAAAVYRAALISWANSMANAGAQSPVRHPTATRENEPFAVDGLPVEHPTLVRYVKDREGLPMFSKPDGPMVSLEVPEDILMHCIDFLEEDSTMRFTDGIKNKLLTLAERWKT